MTDMAQVQSANAVIPPYHLLFVHGDIEAASSYIEASEKDQTIDCTYRSTLSLLEARLIVHMEPSDCVVLDYRLCEDEADQGFVESLIEQSGDAATVVLVEKAEMCAQDFCKKFGLPMVEASANEPEKLIQVVHMQAVIARNKALYRKVHQSKATREAQRDHMNGVAHDIRTPLGVIDSSAQLVEKMAEQSPAIARHCEKIRTAVTNMSNMIDRSLEVARDTMEHLESNCTSLDLYSIVKRIASNAQEQYPQRPISLEVSLPVVPEIYANAENVQRSVENILHNALKYSPGDSLVRLSMEMDDQHITLHVIDKGIGIPSQELPHVGQRFYRASNSENLQGSGIGIYTVRLLVEAMHGQVAIDSQEGQGTTVSLTFMRADALERVLTHVA